MTLTQEIKNIYRLNILREAKFYLTMARMGDYLYGKQHGIEMDERIPYEIQPPSRSTQEKETNRTPALG